MNKVAGLLLGALIAGCAPSTSASPSPSDTAIPARSSSPISTAVLAGSADLASRLRPLVTSWSPQGTNLLVSVRGNDGVSVVVHAVPLDEGAAATPLVAISRTTGTAWRSDGGALAAGVETGANSSRIAAWDLKTGAVRWITADEPGVRHESPVWSADGTSIYYAAHASTQTSYADLGFFRVELDGSGTTRIHGPDENGGMLIGLTPDGERLVWVRIRAGGGVGVLDLETGTNRDFDVNSGSYPEAWRAARPRALVISGGCCAGKPGGTLVLWDELDGSSRVVAGIDKMSKVTAGSAAWDPTGTRIAAQLFDVSNLDYTASIVTMEADGANRTTVPGTAGAGAVLWLREGIVFSRTNGTELVLVSPNGDGPRVLYRGAERVDVAAVIAQ